eukprot:SAG31_NODE_3975_length_3702_cov_42.904246_2_plen_267_part_00
MAGSAAWAVDAQGNRRVAQYMCDNVADNAQLAAYIAAQLMQKFAFPNQVPELQHFIAELLEAHRAPEHVRKLFTEIGLAASRQTIRRRQVRFIGTFEADIAVQPGSIVFLLFDNIGFKKLGRKCSYSQYTLLLYQQVSQRRLQELGILDADDTPVEYRDAIRTERDFLPTKSDYEKMSRRRNKAIEAAIELAMQCGVFNADGVEPAETFGDLEIPERPRTFADGTPISDATVAQIVEREDDEQTSLGAKNGIQCREIWRQACCLQL